MADLKETTAAGVQVNRAAVNPKDVIRKQEHDADMAARPTSTSVASSIGAVAHSPVTVENSNSIDLTLSGQSIQADLRTTANTIIQDAGTGFVDQFSDPVREGDAYGLSKQSVIRSSMAVERKSGVTLLYTGSEGTDYLVDEPSGTLYILVGSGLVTNVGDVVNVTYDYREIDDGSGLVIDETGARVDFGTAHNQAARGDHRHENDHFSATGGSTDTVTVTVGGGQVVKADVRIDPSGNIDETAAGIKVKDNSFATKNHTHNLVTGSTPGFMSSTDKTRLDTLWNEETQQFENTSTVHFTIGSTAKADVQCGVGLKDVGNGVEVDFSLVQAKGETTGYTLILTGAVLGSTANNADYYVGADNGEVPSNSVSDHDVIIPRSGTITRAFMKTRVGGAGSSEWVVSKLRVNDTANTIIGSTFYDTSPAEIDNHGMSLAVTAGDRIALLTTTPVWDMSPSDIQWWCQLWIQ